MHEERHAYEGAQVCGRPRKKIAMVCGRSPGARGKVVSRADGFLSQSAPAPIPEVALRDA